MKASLLEIAEEIAGLPSENQAVLQEIAREATGDRYWTPNFGPQLDAYECEADELFFGGSAGSSKTDLVVGLSLQLHVRSLILRRTNKEVQGLIDRYEEVIGHKDGWNGQKAQWRLDSRRIDLGGCQLERDKQKYKGNPHDLIGFDEISDFTESQYKFIIGWNRSANPEQRCRVVCAGNPPTQPEGLWVIQYWAPWLDKRHQNPAQPGELRWFVAGREVDGPGMYDVPGSKKKAPARSRTFIPGFLEDNPDLARTNYDSTLADLPPEIRDAYREGDFTAGIQDDPWQVIPSDWIRQAQDRWEELPPRGVPMCAIGVDVAQGGTNNTCLAIRHDGWYRRNIKVPGKETPDGSSVAGLVVTHRRDECDVVLDMGGGYGGSPYDRLVDNGIKAKKHVGSTKASTRTKDQTLRFQNKRAEVYWRFREALDPDQFGGSTIALPEDPALVADLTAVKWTLGPNRTIVVIPKKKLIEELGRSPDDGDAVVMAWSSGPRAMTHANEWRPDQRVRAAGKKRFPKANLGKRRR